MKKKFLYGTAAILAGFAAFASGTAEAQDSIRWKMPIAFASNLPGLGSPSQYVAEQLNAASDGEVQVRVYEPGKLVPPFDILSAVSDGKVDAGYTWIGYDQGSIPAIPLFAAVPFGLKPWAYTAWYYYGPGHEMLQEVYANKGYNVHAELCGIIGPETAGWYSNPIEGLQDYEGLKIRFAGLGGKIIEQLGASVTMMPGGELFQALETGTIDATEFSMPAIDQVLGFDQIIKNNLYPGWHQPFTAQYMLINQDAWDGISDAQKALINTTCTAATMMGLAEGEYKNGAVIKELEEKGINIQELPDEVLNELKDVAAQVFEQEAQNDEDFKRVYESQQEFLETYNRWDSVAYLETKFMESEAEDSQSQ